MSEYVFPKFFSYTDQNSGSGSGSGCTSMVPCQDCGLPPGTNLDTHYIDTTVQVCVDAEGEAACCPAVPRDNQVPCDVCPLPPGFSLDNWYIDTSVLVSSDAEGEAACCPIKPREDKPCFDCGFPPGTGPNTHWIDTEARVPMDADGIYACCPVSGIEDGGPFPCSVCPLPPEFSDPNQWKIITDAVFSIPNVCCPVEPNISFGCIPPCVDPYVCIDNQCVTLPPSGEGCDPECPVGYYCADHYGDPVCIPVNQCSPPCSGCQECENGACVDKGDIPCDLCTYENGSIFPPGTSSDTHYVDISVRSCSYNVCCPVVPRDQGSNNIKTVDIPTGQVQFIKFNSNEDSLIKTGGGKGIINDIPPTPLQSIVILDGDLSITKPDILNYRIDTPMSSITLNGNATLTLPTGQNGQTTCFVEKLQFGANASTSYTSNQTNYSGKVNIGFGKLIIKAGGLRHDDLRNVLIGGRNNGNWDGPYGFVTTSSYNNIKDIGYIFGEGGDIIVSWASPGDTNLDGMVDILDVTNILAGNKYDVPNSNPSWSDGDFNYDGIVDILDISFFLSANNYDSGIYLPQNSSFDVTWTPPSQYFASTEKLSVNTNNLSAPSSVNTYNTSFTKGSTQYQGVCKKLTQEMCEKIPGSIWNLVANGSAACADNSCDNINIPSNTYGSCCQSDGSCVTVRDTALSTAETFCNQTLNGVWKGYGSTCTSKSCSGGTASFSDQSINIEIL